MARGVSRSRLGLLLAALLVGACASVEPVRGTMRYAVDTQSTAPSWPAPPEMARFVFAGTLTGEQNFHRDAVGGNALRSFGRWLAGLDASSATPIVLQRPAALIGDERGRLFVSDTSRQAVFVFDEHAGELHVWDRAGGGLNLVAPSGLALGASGELFVADAELAFVVHLDASGEPLARIGRGVLQRPTGVARDPHSGELFVADTMAHDVKVFDSAGALRRTIGRRGEGDGEFNFPTHLAFAGGELYVTDTLNSRVQIFDGATARLVRKFGTRGLTLGSLVRPKGVAVDSEGNVYVIESYHDNLLVFSKHGEFLLPIGGSGAPGGNFYLPSGVWVDAINRVYVADMFNGRIVRFQFLGGG